MKPRLIGLCALLLSGCMTSLQPGVTERDLYVVNTPEYPDNRVFYLGASSDKHRTQLISSYDIKTDDSDPVHGQPLTVIVSSVGLPYVVKNGGGRRDLALILDVQAENQGNPQSIVVWYQRGVLPGQTLNFSNLLIYHQESWDDRVAPYFRVRVMDVAAERNLETREALAEVSKYGGLVALALQNPGLTSAISTATRAASLVLAGRENQLLLDYSVQFYGKARVENSPGSYLTPLKLGRFALVGRKPSELSNQQYWKTPMSFDEINGTIQYEQGNSETPVNTPTVVITITTQEAIVPTLVASKSAYLNRLLTEASAKNLDEIQRESSDLSQRVRAYILREKVYRYRQKGDLVTLIDAMKSKVDPFPSDINESLIRFLRDISGCSSLSFAKLGEWWETEEVQRADFRQNAVRLDLDTGTGCPK